MLLMPRRLRAAGLTRKAEANRPRKCLHVVVRIGVAERRPHGVKEVLAVEKGDRAFDRGLGRQFIPLETITPPGPIGKSGGEEVGSDYKASRPGFQVPNASREAGFGKA